jgi:hypothetical protein
MGSVEYKGHPGYFRCNSSQETRYRSVGVEENIAPFSQKSKEPPETQEVRETQRATGKGEIVEKKSLFFNRFTKTRFPRCSFHGVSQGAQHLHKGKQERSNRHIHGGEKENSSRVHLVQVKITGAFLR